MTNNSILKNKFNIGETVYFLGVMPNSIIEVTVRGLKRDSFTIYYDLFDKDNSPYYIREKDLFPSRTALEASLKNIKPGDTVYWFSEVSSKIKRDVATVIQENRVYFADCTYMHLHQLFKTEEELIKSLRDYNE